MAFEAHQQQISFLLGKKIYCIPRNQRKYVWGNDNWKTCWKIWISYKAQESTIF